MLLLHNAGQFLAMSPPPPTGRRCGPTCPATATATAGTSIRFYSPQSLPSLWPNCLSCPACRYNNKPWGDCDPLLLLRTKHVTLVRDSRYRWGGPGSHQTPDINNLSFQPWRLSGDERVLSNLHQRGPHTRYQGILEIQIAANTASFPRKQEVSRWKQGLQIAEWKNSN